MRHVQSPNHGSQVRVFDDVIQKLGENQGMRDSNMIIEDTEGRGMHGPRGKQAGTKVDIARGILGRWDIQRQVANDLIYLIVRAPVYGIGMCVLKQMGPGKKEELSYLEFRPADSRSSLDRAHLLPRGPDKRIRPARRSRRRECAMKDCKYDSGRDDGFPPSQSPWRVHSDNGSGNRSGGSTRGAWKPAPVRRIQLVPF